MLKIKVNISKLEISTNYCKWAKVHCTWSLNFSSSSFAIGVHLPILNHPCFFMVYYYLFGVFSVLVNPNFQVSFNLKEIRLVILVIAKITQKRTSNTCDLIKISFIFLESIIHLSNRPLLSGLLPLCKKESGLFSSN